MFKYQITVTDYQNQIFLKAFQLSGLKNQNEYLHIGDSYDLNIKPASKFNFKAILIRHFGSKEIFAIS